MNICLYINFQNSQLLVLISKKVSNADSKRLKIRHVWSTEKEYEHITFSQWANVPTSKLLNMQYLNMKISSTGSG